MADDAGGKIDVTGLRSLRRAFKNFGGKKFEEFLRQAHVDIAQKVIEAAKPGVAAQSSRVAGSMRPQRSSTGARIRVGGPAIPWAGGVIFGAFRDQDRLLASGRTVKGWNQFRPFARDQPYHIFPEVDQVRDQIAELYATRVHEFLDAEGVPR